MQMNLARRLSEVIGSWLHLEFCCYRGQLFSENSLKVAVGGVLSTFPAAAKGALVHADFAHDKLNSGGAKGRPRECDFALIAHHSPDAPKCDAEVVVETKWAGSTHCTHKQVCNDLLRLAVIKHAEP